MLQRLIPEGSLKRAFTFVFSGSAAGQLFGLLAAPVLARIFTPEDFGVYGTLMFIAGVVGVVAAGRFEIAFPLTIDEGQAKALGIGCFYVLLAVGGITCVLSLVLGPSMAQIEQLVPVVPFLYLVPLIVLSIGLFNILSQWSARLRCFGVLGSAKTIQGAAASLVQVVCGLMWTSPVGLVVGDIAGRTSAVGILVFPVSRSVRTKTAPLLGVLKRFRRFCMLSAPAAVMNTASQRTPAFFFAAFYGLEAAGFFVLCQRVVGTPIQLVSRSVSQVYSVEFGSKVETDPSANLALFMQISRSIVLYLSIPFLLAAWLAPPITTLVFGQDWVAAGEFMRYLILAQFFQLVAAPVSQTLNLLNRQDLQLAWDIFRLLCICGLFLACGVYLAVPSLLTLQFYCLLIAVLYLVLWLVSYLQVKGSL